MSRLQSRFSFSLCCVFALFGLIAWEYWKESSTVGGWGRLRKCCRREGEGRTCCLLLARLGGEANYALQSYKRRPLDSRAQHTAHSHTCRLHQGQVSQGILSEQSHTKPFLRLLLTAIITAGTLSHLLDTTEPCVQWHSASWGFTCRFESERKLGTEHGTRTS